jgi:acyl-CoA synthetase (AMP-forming)/AMP-acid ligase II
MSHHAPSDTLLTARALIDDPIGTFGGSYTLMETADPGEVERLRLDGLRLRFEELRDRIPTLKKLADRQQIEAIDDVEDVVPLLFDHTMYKSYPSQLLIGKRFDRLTDWLGRLTATDLSEVDASSCDSIDEWLDTLDAATELRVSHTSGTSGTLSLVPWTRPHIDHLAVALATVYGQTFGVVEDVRDAEPFEVIVPYFRHGGAMACRLNDSTERKIARAPERFHPLFEARVSSDVLYLAARLRAATAKGQAHTLDIDPGLLARKDEFEQLMSGMPQQVDAFLLEAADTLAGRRIWVFGTQQTISSMAEAGLASGHRNVFAPDSVVTIAGGGKGWTPPPDCRERILEFFGCSELREMYGMSEIMLLCRRCSEDRFHINPWVIPFILDPDTSKPLLREGVTTGRAAFFDLSATTRWGGYITGDEITLHWDYECPCGRTTMYLDSHIERYSEKRGGDDKISCVATEAAHQEALDYLTSIEVD